MKRITIILFSLILTLPIAAQKKTLELGIYGGLQTYTKIGNPYENSFSSGFGIGFLSKYYISNRLFWTTDLPSHSSVRLDKESVLGFHLPCTWVSVCASGYGWSSFVGNMSK